MSWSSLAVRQQSETEAEPRYRINVFTQVTTADRYWQNYSLFSMVCVTAANIAERRVWRRSTMMSTIPRRRPFAPRVPKCGRQVQTTFTPSHFRRGPGSALPPWLSRLRCWHRCSLSPPRRKSGRSRRGSRHGPPHRVPRRLLGPAGRKPPRRARFRALTAEPVALTPRAFPLRACRHRRRSWRRRHRREGRCR
jgi:hypothetical protein